jgi:ATP synthase I chain
MEPDQAYFDAALRRIVHWSVGLAGAGCLICLVLRGWNWAAAFLLGAGAGYLNFRWLKRIVDALGAASEARPRARFAVLSGLRYLLLAAGAYAILNLTNLSLPAALTGLFVPVAAVILEIIFELIYASH